MKTKKCHLLIDAIKNIISIPGKDAQMNATNKYKVIEWIPYKDLKILTKWQRMNLEKICKAKWFEGPIYNWGVKNKRWKTRSQLNGEFKKFDNIAGLNEDFFNETAFCKITQDPETNEYIMVWVLKNNFNNFNWKLKLDNLRPFIITYEIVNGFARYYDFPHDIDLARENVTKNSIYIQKLITRIIMKCWDSRVTHRLTFNELKKNWGNIVRFIRKIITKTLMKLQFKLKILKKLSKKPRIDKFTKSNSNEL
ncbi:hypothetical protein Glove_151g148 [Diversispora epigaea]|uniref:Serine-threonine/tyrosine-protein kinase catalytic domain-containing protein n=1 Tax=Diversispora epigaea TaxID=1348612 RepID=A0A397IWL5_9GLOM|nr:hypothetical protein Glove_151g148 [Diversispora epigaea]